MTEQTVTVTLEVPIGEACFVAEMDLVSATLQRYRSAVQSALEALPPPEPAVGSIVTDCTGDAWQRRYGNRECWYTASPASEPRAWESILENWGPVKVLREGR